MGTRRIFPIGGQIRESGDDERPPVGSSPVGIWGRYPQKPTTNCQNNA